MTVFVEVTDKFLESNDQSKSLLNEATKSLFDAIALITHANCDLNHRCPDLIKPDLNRSYQQICLEQIELTEKLFGDDLPPKKISLQPTRWAINSQTQMGNTCSRIVQMAKISDDHIFQKTVNGLDGDSRPINRNGKAARGTVHIL